MKRAFSKILILFVFSALLLSCSRQREPLQRLEASLATAPDYSIILNDIKEEGMFSKSYYHKYKVVQGDKAYFTDWLRVSENTYRSNQNFLGMTLVSKTEGGKRTSTPYPPGYQHVGNSQYGQWRQNRSGNSFWEFYGKYAFFSSLFGLGNRPFYRNDYNNFRSYQTTNRPYFGSKRQYGTRGSYTKRTNPNFFERSMAKKRTSKTRFSERVNRRFGGSRSVFGRGRSGFGGFGK